MTDIKELVESSKEQIELLPLCKLYKEQGYGKIIIEFIKGEIVSIKQEVSFQFLTRKLKEIE